MSAFSCEPYVRFAHRITRYVAYPKRVCAFDHRLFYLTEGSFTLEISSGVYPLTAGDMVIFPPGTPYRLEIDSHARQEYILVNFDLEQPAEVHPARHPVPEEQFDPEEIFSARRMPPFDQPFFLLQAKSIEPILEELRLESFVQSPLSREIQSTLLRYVLLRAIDLSQSMPRNPKKLTALYSAKKFIDQNIASPISNRSVAEKLGYHPNYLNSLFTQYEHTTLHKYIDGLRLRRAKEFLSSSDLPVHEVALRCGFSDSSYFARFFLRHTGILPREYRNLSK